MIKPLMLMASRPPSSRTSKCPPSTGRCLVGSRRGKFGLIAGLPDYGKGQIAAFIAAAITANVELPCNEGHMPPGNVIWFNAEDGAADTIKPRLTAAGADVNRIHLVNSTRVGG